MAKSNRKKNITKKPGFRLGMIASGIMIIFALIFLFLWFSYRSLFNNNAHFVLKRVIVRSGGWWKLRSKEVETILDLTPGKTNIFDINLAEKRAQLETEPSIEKTSISRVLPDTLSIDIIERIPTAFLYKSEYPKVVDEHGIVMLTKSCVDVDHNLPVITGFRAAKDDTLPGKELHQILPAIKFLNLASKHIPEMHISRISMSDPKFFNSAVSIPGLRKKYTLYIARKGLSQKIDVLKVLLDEVARNRPDAKIIDMRYEGQAVVK